MKQFLLLSLCFGLSGLTCLAQASNEERMMTANGTFSVELSPQQDDGFPAGRMLIEKQFSGDLTGTGMGQMISKRTAAGSAVYYAVEEVSGALHGRTGNFTLVHRGSMDATSQSLEVLILNGSGGGELQGISGSMTITQDDAGHQYQLSYELNDSAK